MSSTQAAIGKPLIGISTYVEPSASWRAWEMPAVLLPTPYIRMVQASGGIAVMLPPDKPAAAWATVAGLDGIVIAGGPDVDPERYGATRDLRTDPPASDRDAWELALIAAALALKTPLLGICRGMQLINVAFGGTLVQHLEGHGHGVAGMYSSHPVSPVDGTLYHSLVPETTAVATYHHQAVDRLGAGLRASAHAGDGTIEAVEAIEGREVPWIMGVQWHPEMGTDRRVVAALLRATAEEARRPQLVS
ncbi:gamma-glutamyl-gamma-aminobutyrate hydrolase family protein [Kitasatospora paranensis]|uniref:Gamma-glutamyl-gamma-aminobutyrate hydrolase family protein n=1 Tax=Kitasatospora paranensis TaxID=258053 RepID=A0ABW2G3R5_9ACTN